jgi:hypothetical protein
MFPRINAFLVRISSGFYPQARMISLSCSILLACVFGEKLIIRRYIVITGDV